MAKASKKSGASMGTGTGAEGTTKGKGKGTTKGKATAANGKAKAVKSRKSTGNLRVSDARKGVLVQLRKKEANRNQLKAVVPFGNYTALMGALEEDGLVTPVEYEGERLAVYTITAKGREAAK